MNAKEIRKFLGVINQVQFNSEKLYLETEFLIYQFEDKYRWILSSSLRGMIQFYVDEIYRRGFFDDTYILSVGTKKSSSDTTKRLETFESFIKEYFEGSNTKKRKKIFYDFYKREMNSNTKILENHLLTNNGSGSYLEVYRSLHTTMHGKPESLTTNTLLTHMNAIMYFMFICEFFIQSYDESGNWDFLNINL